MKRVGFFALAMLILWTASTCAEEDPESYAYPKEDSIRLAEHLMVGMFGYSEKEAKAMRYEASIEPWSICTDVRAYPLADSDSHFDLGYLWDGSLIEWKTTVPSCYAPYAQTISPDEACQEAYHLMIGLYGYDPQVAAQFRYEAIPHEDIHIIYVNVYPFPETDEYGEEHFHLEYAEHGSLEHHTIPDILDFSPFYEMEKRVKRPFPWFSHEEKAAYSKEYICKEEAVLRLKPSSADAIFNYDFTRCVYGVPDESVLLEDTALEIAQGVLMERFGRSAEWAIQSGWESYFDVTDPERPLWKFHFTHFDGVEHGQYVVRLDAKTGEIVKAFEWNDDYESYERY